MTYLLASSQRGGLFLMFILKLKVFEKKIDKDII
jgi:hypothetical protein